jgi:hypothetical protein
MTLQECKRYLDAVNLTRIAIPAICKAEISRMRGAGRIEPVGSSVTRNALDTIIMLRM